MWTEIQVKEVHLPSHLFWIKTEFNFDMENAYGLDRAELMKSTGFSSYSSSVHWSCEAKPPSLLQLMALLLSGKHVCHHNLALSKQTLWKNLQTKVFITSVEENPEWCTAHLVKDWMHWLPTFPSLPEGREDSYSSRTFIKKQAIIWRPDNASEVAAHKSTDPDLL